MFVLALQCNRIKEKKIINATRFLRKVQKCSHIKELRGNPLTISR
jgi:hypothetical protein